jgi:hypothetical protein
MQEDAYVSVEELTKSWISFNHNPPKMSQRPTWFSLSIPTKRRTIQTSRGFTTILGSSRATLAIYGIQSPRVTNATRSSRERVRCSCLKVAHSRELKSSQEQDSGVKLRKRGESSRTES